MPASRSLAFACVTAAYVAALLAAAAVVFSLPDASPITRVVAADVVGTLVVFGFAAVFRNSSFYDPYWSVAPPVIAAYLAFLPGPAPALRAALVVFALSVYGVRLTHNWARGWRGLEHEDWRYGDLRAQTGVFFPLVNLFGIMLFPTVLVLLGCWPLGPALVTGAAPANAWDAVALVVVLGGTLLEGWADAQLRTFVRTRTSPEAVLDTGLWAWSRHPNYLGEILVWVGVAFFGYASGDLGWVHLSGVAAMVLLFVGISIPMMEKRQLARKPAYADYIASTPMLVPGVGRSRRVPA